MTYTTRNCDIYLGNELFAQVPANPGKLSGAVRTTQYQAAQFIAEACNDHARLKKEVAHACEIISGLMGYIELEKLHYDSGFKHLARAFLVKHDPSFKVTK